MSSFTTSKNTANDFGVKYDGVGITTMVPRERILSSPATGFGSLAEHEVVVLAGPGEYSVYRKKYGY